MKHVLSSLVVTLCLVLSLQKDSIYLKIRL